MSWHKYIHKSSGFLGILGKQKSHKVRAINNCKVARASVPPASRGNKAAMIRLITKKLLSGVAYPFIIF